MNTGKTQLSLLALQKYILTKRRGQSANESSANLKKKSHKRTVRLYPSWKAAQVLHNVVRAPALPLENVKL
jgi:hypothetical protein